MLLAADFKITEFMASNATYDDVDGESSDWIEVANLGDTAASLDGWYLTDKSDNLDKWQVPDVTLSPNEHIVIWASGKDRDDPFLELHTNFSLKAGGEFLGLVQPDGQTVASDYGLFYPQQYRDVSYGLSETQTGGVITPGVPRYFSLPSPGYSNVDATLDTAPFPGNVSHGTDPMATAGEDLVITTEVILQGAPLASIELHGRINFDSEITVTMTDDGTGADAFAGDGIFTYAIDSSLFESGDLIRYYFTTESTDGSDLRFPFFKTPESSRYLGTVVADPTVSSQLPIFHWFAEDPIWYENPDGSHNYDEASTVLFYDGVLFDNTIVRVKGRISGQQLAPKFKFNLPDDKPLEYSDTAPSVKAFDFGSGYQDPTYSRTALAYQVYREVGSLASDSFPVHTRLNGDFYRLSTFVERINSTFLEHNDLNTDNAIYEADGVYDSVNNLLPYAHLGTTDGMVKKNREEIEPDFDDLEELIDGIAISNPDRLEYMLDNLNIPEIISTLSVYTLTKHFDSACHNYYMVRDTEGNQLWNLVPWDLDTIWDRLSEPIGGPYIDGHPFQGSSEYPSWGPEYWNRLIDTLTDVPLTQEMYLRRLRTLMDEYLKPPGTPSGQLVLEPRLYAMTGTLELEAADDYAKWGQKTGGSWGNVGDLDNGIDHLVERIDWRRDYLYGLDIIPDEQPQQFDIEFGNIQVDPISGDQGEEYIEIVNPNNFAIDISGWELANAVTHTFAGGTVIPAASVLYVVRDQVEFRARETGPGSGLGLLIQGDYKGRLSRDGETIELLNTAEELVRQLTYAAMPDSAPVTPIPDQAGLTGIPLADIVITLEDPLIDPATLQYTAETASIEYILDQRYNLSAPDEISGLPPYFEDYHQMGEKYLVNNDGIHPSNQYYYIMPNGDFYRFTGSITSSDPLALRGELIASLGTDVYDDPTQLTDATNDPVPASLNFSLIEPNVLSIAMQNLYTGSFPVTVTQGNTTPLNYTTFTVTITEPVTGPPEIQPIANQNAVTGVPYTVVMSYSDPDTPLPGLTLSATAMTAEYYYDQQLNLTEPPPPYNDPPFYADYRGRNEKYFYNPDGTHPGSFYYYLLPGGGLYLFTGDFSETGPSSLVGDLIFNFGPEIYDNPRLLCDASNDISQLSLDTSNGQLIVNASSGGEGAYVIEVTVSDGSKQDTEDFMLSVTEPVTAPPELQPIANQDAITEVPYTVVMSYSDPDTPLPGLTLSATAMTAEYYYDQLLNLTEPPPPYDDPPFYADYRGRDEKYFYNPDGIHPGSFYYYLLPGGGLYLFTGDFSETGPSSLTGDLIFNFGPKIYDNPLLLCEATNDLSQLDIDTSTGQLIVTADAGGAGNYLIDVTVSDGSKQDMESFMLTVTQPVSEPPEIQPIADQSAVIGTPYTVIMDYSDPDTPLPGLTLSATATSAAYYYDQQLNLTEPPPPYNDPPFYADYRGQDEKYFYNPDGTHPGSFYYYLLPGGGLYLFTGDFSETGPSSLVGDLIFNFGPEIYDDPLLLCDATNDLSQLDIDTSTGQLIVTVDAGSAGGYLIDVTVSDGSKQDMESFILTMTQPGTEANAGSNSRASNNPTSYNDADLNLLLSSMGHPGSQYDLNNDDIVDGQDLAILLEDFGKTNSNTLAVPIGPIDQPTSVSEQSLQQEPVFVPRGKSDETSSRRISRDESPKFLQRGEQTRMHLRARVRDLAILAATRTRSHYNRWADIHVEGCKRNRWGEEVEKWFSFHKDDELFPDE